MRIKLLAPGYPKRVLHTVKWLGDVYAMPIEAIQVQLFEDAGGRYQLTFERLLPLKSDDAFDLTVKAAEERIAGVVTPKRPAILKTLLENGILEPGQKLWLHPNIFTADEKHLFDPDNPIFELTLDVSEGRPMFRWRRTPDAPGELLSPSLAWFPIFRSCSRASTRRRFTRPSTAATRWSQEVPRSAKSPSSTASGRTQDVPLTDSRQLLAEEPP